MFEILRFLSGAHGELRRENSLQVEACNPNDETEGEDGIAVQNDKGDSRHSTTICLSLKYVTTSPSHT